MTKSSRNALKHGAQAQPPTSLTLAHLNFMLGYRVVDLDEVLVSPRLMAALHLASCEARLDQAHAHYVEAQGVHREEDLDNLIDHLEDLLYFVTCDEQLREEVFRRVAKMEVASKFYANRRKRLANRYLAEAQSQRRRSLKNYLEICFPETK